MKQLEYYQIHRTHEDIWMTILVFSSFFLKHAIKDVISENNITYCLPTPRFLILYVNSLDSLLDKYMQNFFNWIYFFLLYIVIFTYKLQCNWDVLFSCILRFAGSNSCFDQIWVNKFPYIRFNTWKVGLFALSLQNW